MSSIGGPTSLTGGPTHLNDAYPSEESGEMTVWQYYKAAAIPGLAATDSYDRWCNLIDDAEAIAAAAVEGDQERNEEA